MRQNSSIKDQALHPDSKSRPQPANLLDPTAAGKSGQSAELDDRILTALAAAADKKALDTIVLDLRGIASFTDYFLISSGTNTRQVQAIADAIVEQLKAQGSQAARVEGYQTAEWILADYGDFIVHVFEDKARRFYDLERLWRDAPRVELAGESGPGQ
jgi:ribosome-associated protein